MLTSSRMSTAISFNHPSDDVSSARLHSDELLHASRELDWRFLLPDPRLQRVAYVGAVRRKLVDSLRRFSASLTLSETPPPWEGITSQYDVVVASNPTCKAMRWAATLVREGGHLYVRVSRNRCWIDPLSKPDGPRLRYVDDHLAVIKRLGFTEAAAYWHWPSFETCAEIVPLDQPEALEHFFSRRRKRGIARLKVTLGRGLIRLRMFQRLVACFSIVAQRRYPPVPSWPPPVRQRDETTFRNK